jgi:hypothetical protein
MFIWQYSGQWQLIPPLTAALMKEGDPDTGIAYSQNKQFDKNEDGIITKEEASSFPQNLLSKGSSLLWFR